jgi:hypothetical protein
MFHLHARARNQFVILAPGGSQIPGAFDQVEFDAGRHGRMLAAVQRLRGKAYLTDGAICPDDLTPDGRHLTAEDNRAWHLVSLDNNGKLGACLRFLDERHAPGFRGLWVSHAAMAHSPELGWKLRMAVECQLEMARTHRIGFGSVGGWASAPQERRKMQPVALALAIFALMELLGGCIGVATATLRHQSASILRRIGLRPLSWTGAELPSYFDPQYGCEMEILQFDSAFVNPKYRESVQGFQEQLLYAPVICRESATQFAEASAIPAVA